MARARAFGVGLDRTTFACDSGAHSRGNPETNGLGHTLLRAEWHDGVEREVVLIPKLTPDLMDVDFEWTAGHKHKTLLDDGKLNFSPGQQADLFKETRRSIRDGPRFLG